MAAIIEITLEPSDIEECEELARKRQATAEALKLPPRNGATEDPVKALKYHRHGAFGECAGALYLWPIEWHRYFDRRMWKYPDLGDFVDTKATPTGKGRLPVQKETGKPNWAYLHVTLEAFPTCRLRGWIWGREAMVADFWGDLYRNGRPAFFVPQETLRSTDSLYTLIHGNRGKPP